MYNQGDEIEVIIDRDSIGLEAGVGHLDDDTMVFVVGAEGKTGQNVRATVVAIEQMRLGMSVVANAV